MLPITGHSRRVRRSTLTMHLVNDLLVSLIPIRVTMVASCTFLLYIGMSEGLKKRERRLVVRLSIYMAFLERH